MYSMFNFYVSSNLFRVIPSYVSLAALNLDFWGTVRLSVGQV